MPRGNYKKHILQFKNLWKKDTFKDNKIRN